MESASEESASDAKVLLQLSLGDATQRELPREHYHACFLDAFSPDVNPECWRIEFLAKLFDSGFQVQKRPGPPGKRDIVTAVKPLA